VIGHGDADALNVAVSELEGLPVEKRDASPTELRFVPINLYQRHQEGRGKINGSREHVTSARGIGERLLLTLQKENVLVGFIRHVDFVGCLPLALVRQSMSLWRELPAGLCEQ
jgi:hypothetical protein